MIVTTDIKDTSEFNVVSIYLSIVLYVPVDILKGRMSGHAICIRQTQYGRGVVSTDNSS